MRPRLKTSKLEQEVAKGYKAFCERRKLKTGKWTARKVKT